VTAIPGDMFRPIAAREAPVKTEGLVPWVRINLFGNLWSSVATVIVAAILGYALVRLLDWGFFSAVFERSPDACQAARGTGACWGVIAEKHRIILFGRFPFDEQWRPLVATLVLLALIIVSCIRRFWHPLLAVLWIVVIPAVFMLMGGGVFGLTRVPTDQWGSPPSASCLLSRSRCWWRSAGAPTCRPSARCASSTWS